MSETMSIDVDTKCDFVTKKGDGMTFYCITQLVTASYHNLLLHRFYCYHCAIVLVNDTIVTINTTAMPLIVHFTG